MSDKPIKFHKDDKAYQKAEKLLNESLAAEDNRVSSDSELATLSSESADSNKVFIKNKPKKGRLKQLFWPSLTVFVLFAAGYEAYQFISRLLSSHWLLGWGAGLLATTVVVSGVYSLYTGWKARRRLKKRQQQQKQLQAILLKNSYGQADAIIQEVNQEIEEFTSVEPLRDKYQQRKRQVHNDQELIQIYSDTVLKGLDKMAVDMVTKHATEAAAMVALSPLSAVDMALVAWRGSRMIEQLSQLYGCPQTVLGRLEMTKKVFKNMMLAGASELVADAGVEFLGKTLTATISTKAAQGIGVGLLIARMGLQTMNVCRPLEFDKENKPKLSQVRKSIYSKVKGLIKNATGSVPEKKK